MTHNFQSDSSQVFSQLNKQNVLTRQQLKLDWLKVEQKLAFSAVVETGFVASLFFVRFSASFADRRLAEQETRYAVFWLRFFSVSSGEKINAHATVTFSLSLFSRTFHLHIKNGVKRFSLPSATRFGNWKALEFTSRRTKGILMEMYSNWIHAIASALSFRLLGSY